jgi:putative endopeptidase
MVRLPHISFAVAALAFALVAIAEEPARPIGPGFDVANIDKTADPCVDFYQYACGAWLARNPVPADMPVFNRGVELMTRNQEKLRGILEKAPASSKPGDDYAACMDEAGIESLGLKPIEPALARVAGLKSKGELPAVVAELHRLSVPALFAFGSEQDFADARQVIGWLDQGGLGLPDRDFYLRDDPRSTEVRQAYVGHIGKMLGLLGEAPEAAAAAAARVMEIETALAKVSVDRVTRRDPAKLHHRTTRKELAAAAPAFAWDRYFSEVGAPAFESLNVASPDFMKGLSAQLESADLDSWKAYLRWHLVRDSARLLPKAFVQENFAFYGRVLSGARELRPRWKRCVQIVEENLGEELGRRFVEETFGPEGRKRTLEMVRALEASLEKDIRSLEWMSDATEKEALAKLHAIRNKIGHPDRWRDYTGLEIQRGAALGNAQRAAAFELRRELAKIGTAVDRDEWPFPPTIVQAGYNPLLNEILFTAAILQPPFYENRLDDAVNFGAVGAVIGHELTHGFDDQGRRFDSAGNLRDWWAAGDSAEFEKRAACFVEQYSAYTSVADVKLNGKLTLGENTADNGGVRVAYQALLASLAGKPKAAIDGYTPEQRFFLGFAQIACENKTEAMARMRAQTDPHSPGRHRVNGVVSNMPEFHQAFECKAGQPMVREPACKVW